METAEAETQTAAVASPAAAAVAATPAQLTELEDALRGAVVAREAAEEERATREAQLDSAQKRLADVQAARDALEATLQQVRADVAF